MGAAAAYALGFDGAGVLVGILDSGVDGRHPEFAGTVAGGHDFVGGGATTDQNGHGTHVAGIVAGGRDGRGFHGVAPGARVLPLKVVAPDGEVRTGFRYATIRQAFARALDDGASVLNNSWASPIPIGLLSRETIVAVVPDMVEAGRLAAARDAVVVFAAGNAGLGDPAWEAGLPVRFPELERIWLAVVALEVDGRIWEPSNRCGIARAFCVAAPGVGIVSARPGGGTRPLSGTSMAAAQVSGAAAILRQMFPDLAAEEIVDILKRTARDLGEPGVDGVYGWGLVDLERAARPIGPLAVRLPDGGGTVPLASTGFATGGVLGDAVAGAFAGRSVAVVDGYRRPYAVAMGDLAVVRRDRGTRIAERLARFARPAAGVRPGTGAHAAAPPWREGSPAPASTGTEDLSLAVSTGSGAADALAADAAAPPFRASPGAAHLDLLDGGGALAIGWRGGAVAWRTVVRWSAEESDGPAAPETEGHGLSIDVTSDRGGLATTLTAGVVEEARSVLGGRGSGALAVDGARTVFAGLRLATAPAPGIELAAAASFGVSRLRPGDGSLIEGGWFRTTAAALTLTVPDVFGPGDRLTLGISQPVRADGGALDLRLSDGTGGARRFRADVSPTGRQVDVGIGYAAALGDGAELRLGLGVSRQPGNVRKAGREILGLVAARLVF